MNELIEKRTQNSKTFLLPNGRKGLDISISAAHYRDNYQDPTEQWKDIDLTWVGNKITKAPYELTLDGSKITVRDKKTGEVSTIELIETKPAGIKWEIIPENTRVSFRHILPSDKAPFQAQFKVMGKIPLTTRAGDDEGELPLETTLKDGILTEKLSNLPRPSKGNIRVDPTLEVDVTAGTDDCGRCQGLVPYFELALSAIEMGAGGANYHKKGGGFRFCNITIPNAETITTANIVFTSRDTLSGTTVNLRVSAEDVDDAVTFADDGDAFDTRFAAHTTARIDWDAVPAWSAGECGADTTTPEIKTVVQEIVDRVGWASGQDMVFFVEDFDDRSTQSAQRYCASYEHATYNPAKLHIEYPTLHEGAATLAGVGTLAGIAHVTLIGASTLSGVGTLAAKGARTFIGKATLSGTGTLAAIGGFWQYGIATLAGVGTLVTKGTNYCGIGVNLTLQERPTSLTLQKRPINLTLQERPTSLTLPKGD